ncbi:hypothetical protein H5410_020808 [Solanum commersonii]|uniref:Uncharacterized protein n=1 Tax=Solanum commersonii TaxID=4109 RepID=A0A9J5ZC68_SOLCO|nr:hypothetical protein H5410_020808 [Solanum commersonii]
MGGGSWINMRAFDWNTGQTILVVLLLEKQQQLSIASHSSSLESISGKRVRWMRNGLDSIVLSGSVDIANLARDVPWTFLMLQYVLLNILMDSCGTEALPAEFLLVFNRGE